MRWFLKIDLTSLLTMSTSYSFSTSETYICFQIPSIKRLQKRNWLVLNLFKNKKICIYSLENSMLREKKVAESHKLQLKISIYLSFLYKLSSVILLHCFSWKFWRLVILYARIQLTKLHDVWKILIEKMRCFWKKLNSVNVALCGRHYFMQNDEGTCSVGVSLLTLLGCG